MNGTADANHIRTGAPRHIPPHSTVNLLNAQRDALKAKSAVLFHLLCDYKRPERHPRSPQTKKARHAHNFSFFLATYFYLKEPWAVQKGDTLYFRMLDHPIDAQREESPIFTEPEKCLIEINFEAQRRIVMTMCAQIRVAIVIGQDKTYKNAFPYFKLKSDGKKSFEELHMRCLELLIDTALWVIVESTQWVIVESTQTSVIGHIHQYLDALKQHLITYNQVPDQSHLLGRPFKTDFKELAIATILGSRKGHHPEDMAVFLLTPYFNNRWSNILGQDLGNIIASYLPGNMNLTVAHVANKLRPIAGPIADRATQETTSGCCTM
jgi:hypothetical protein